MFIALKQVINLDYMLFNKDVGVRFLFTKKTNKFPFR